MVVLQDIIWPRLVPINKTPTSESIPASFPSSQSNLVKTLGARIEANEEISRQESLEGSRSSTPTLQIAEFSSHQIPPTAIAPMEGPSDNTPANPGIDTQDTSVLGPYALPPSPVTPFQTVENSSLSHRRVATPMVMANVGPAGSAADETESYPKSRWSFAQFRYGSDRKESFDTSMQALIQSRPDSPIGGKEAPPMKNMAYLGANDYFGPYIEITSPTGSSKDGRDKALRTQSNFSDPFWETTSSKLLSRPQSPIGDKTPQMVTAPASPLVPADRHNLNDMSYDGVGVVDTAVRDFVTDPDPNACPDAEHGLRRSRSSASDTRPDTECGLTPEGTSPQLAPLTGKVTMTNIYGLPVPVLVTPTSDVPELSITFEAGRGFNAPKVSGAPDFQNVPETSSTHRAAGGPSAPKFPGASNRPDIPGLPDVPNLSDGLYLPGGPVLPDVLRTPDVPNLPDVLYLPDVSGLPEVPISSAKLPSLAAPADLTGALPAPGTPSKPFRMSKVAKRGVQRSIRMGRRAVLRERVLKIAIGRQLAKPTAAALKLISKGIEINVTDVQGAVPDIQGAVPVPLPVPMPL